jgi:hypothetical protein
MSMIPIMRAGTLSIVLAAGALVGCSSPGAMVAATNPSMVPPVPAARAFTAEMPGTRSWMPR